MWDAKVPFRGGRELQKVDPTNKELQKVDPTNNSYKWCYNLYKEGYSPSYPFIFGHL